MVDYKTANLEDPSTLFAVTCPACFSFSLNIKFCTRCHIKIPTFINIKAISKVDNSIKIFEITEKMVSTDSALKDILQQRVDSSPNSTPPQFANTKGLFADCFKKPISHTEENHVEGSASTCEIPQNSSSALVASVDECSSQGTNIEKAPKSNDSDVGKELKLHEIGEPVESMDADVENQTNSDEIGDPADVIMDIVNEIMNALDRKEMRTDENMDADAGSKVIPDKSLDIDAGNQMTSNGSLDAEVANQRKPDDNHDADNSNNNMKL